MAGKYGDLTTIIDSLIAGNSVRIRFNNESEIFTFRSSLYRTKKIHEDAMIGVELMTENDSPIIEWKRMYDGKGILVVLSPKPKKLYNFTIIGNEDESESEPQ